MSDDDKTGYGELYYAAGEDEPPKARADRRREFLWSLMVGGFPVWKAKKITAQKFRNGKPVTDRTLRRDIELLTEQAREAHDNAEEHELGVRAIVERLARRSNKADKAGAYHAATQADKVLLQVYGIRSARWRPKSHVDVQHSGAVKLDDAERVIKRVAELRELDAAELLDKREQLVARLKAMGVKTDEPAEA